MEASRVHPRPQQVAGAWIVRHRAWPLCAFALVALIAWLVPPRSDPVGFDVYWNLLVARSWAERGVLPARLPAAGGTILADGLGDPHLGFHAVLAALGGDGLDEGAVPWLLWLLVASQGLVLTAAIRIAAPRTSPWWLLLLPAMSQQWLFRCTELRAMLLAILFVLPMLAVFARGDGERRPRRVVLALLAAAFTLCHGAAALPLWLAGLATIGTRLQGRRWPWGEAAAVAIGVLAGCVLRPDFPLNLVTLRALNLVLPLASLRGELSVLPCELSPLALRDLLATEWPFLLALVVLALRVWRRPRARAWSLLLPVAGLALSAFCCRRMFELAAPALLLALATSWQGRVRAGIAIAGFVVACLVHAPLAADGARVNRHAELREVAGWITQRAHAGDVVFVTDWAVSSPLAFATRGRGLVFTGMLDPVFQYAHDPQQARRWQAIKRGADPDPIGTMRRAFAARFLVFSRADAMPDEPLGAGAERLRGALLGEARRGASFELFAAVPEATDAARTWFVVDLEPASVRDRCTDSMSACPRTSK